MSSPLRPEAELRAMLDAVPAFFALFAGPEHRVEYVNPAMCRLFGDREVLGLPLDGAFPEIAALPQRKLWDEALHDGSRRDLQEVVVTLPPTSPAGARAAWMDLTLMPRTDPNDGSVRGLSVFGMEVTARVRARDEFFSIATHEIKTPLATVALKLDLLNRSTKHREAVPSDEVSAALDVARRQVQRLATLTDNLLDVARLANGKLQLDVDDVDLSSVAREVVERFAEHARRAGCNVTLDLEDPLVGRWDRLRLEQVVSNLVSNALKYGAGCAIRVRTRREREAAVLTVVDSGIGIAAEDQARIFERFERATHERGAESMGLGLFVVRELVRAHGGDVTVESEAGKGATFRVELPARAPEETRT